MFYRLIIYILIALAAASSFTYLSTIVVVIIRGLSTLDIYNILVEEILRLSVTIILPTYTLDLTIVIFVKTLKVSTILVSYSLVSYTTLIIDVSNTKPVIAKDYITIIITNSYKANLSLLLRFNIRSLFALDDSSATLFPKALLT